MPNFSAVPGDFPCRAHDLHIAYFAEISGFPSKRRISRVLFPCVFLLGRTDRFRTIRQKRSLNHEKIPMPCFCSTSAAHWWTSARTKRILPSGAPVSGRWTKRRKFRIRRHCGSSIFRWYPPKKGGCGSCGDPARKSTGPSYSGSFSGMPESRRTSVPCRALPPSSGQPPVPHGRNGIDRINWNFAA